MSNPTLLSAQVVLEHAKSQSDELREALRVAGFTVEPVFAGSFAITAPSEQFERYFGMRLVRPPAGGSSSVAIEGSLDLELPLTAVPNGLRQQIKAVLFSRSPDFGPGAF